MLHFCDFHRQELQAPKLYLFRACLKPSLSFSSFSTCGKNWRNNPARIRLLNQIDHMWKKIVEGQPRREMSFPVRRVSKTVRSIRSECRRSCRHDTPEWLRCKLLNHTFARPKERSVIGLMIVWCACLLPFIFLSLCLSIRFIWLSWM